MAKDKENKGGRPKAIKSPQELWDYFVRYMKEIKADPFEVNDFRGKDADEVILRKEKPLSMAGFERFVYEQHDIEFNGVDQYFSNRDNSYDEFVGICSRIKAYIRGDQIEGGAAGIYNASITQRLNGLHETIKQENFNPDTITVNVVKGNDRKKSKKKAD